MTTSATSPRRVTAALALALLLVTLLTATPAARGSGSLTVTVDRAVSQVSPTSSRTVWFRVVFSEPIDPATFTAADVDLGGNAGATSVVIGAGPENNGRTFNLAVSGMTQAGAVTASIPAGRVTDLAGNPNAASTSTTGTIEYTPPLPGLVRAWGGNSFGQTTVPNGLTGVTAIDAVIDHTVALRSDGTVVAWGSNASGQTTVPAGLTGVTAIAAGEAHTVALRSDGTVAAWGGNPFGQTTVPNGLTSVTAIAAGGSHTVALRSNGTVVAWGANWFGQATVPPGLTGITAIAAGRDHTVALRSDGTVVAWGDNSEGQRTVPAGLTGVTAIAASGAHTVALRSDGTVVAWGRNSFGQTNVPAGLTGVTAIDAGFAHTVALRGDGTVVAWGSNASGQTNVPAGLTGVTAIAAGLGHTVALTRPTPPAPAILAPIEGARLNTARPAISGTAEAGATVTVLIDGGALGTATANAGGAWSLTPASDLAAGSRVAVARATNSLGITGPDSPARTFTIDTTAPSVSVDRAASQVSPTSSRTVWFRVVFSEPIDPATFTAADVDLGGNAGATSVVIGAGPENNGRTFNLAVSGMTQAGAVTASIPAGRVTDLAGNPNAASTSATGTIEYTPPLPGLVRAWGWNSVGQTDVPPGLTGVTAIAAGYAHTVALRSDGTVRAWGWNDEGQTSVPAGLTGVTAIAAGYAHTVALRSDGTVVAWGRNSAGQTTVPPGLTGVTAIAAGYAHTVALRSDGTVVAWGANWFGQRTVPPGLTGVTAIAAGDGHTVALRSDGTVVAWGWNADGQTTVPLGLTGVTAIAAGAGHTVALRSDGTVRAWGRNLEGQTTVPPDLTGVTAIAAGAYYTVALKSDGTVVAWGDNSAGQTTVPAGLTGVTAIAAGGFHTVVLARPTPPAPAILAPSAGAVVGSARPTISGTAEPGATVTLLIDGDTLGTVTADAGGAWSLTPASDLAAGSRSAVARATNSLGITGPDSPARTFAIDTTAPSVTVSSPAPDPTSTSPIPVTVTFGEDVTGFAAADLEVTNATVGDFSGSGATYTFTLTPSGQGSVGVRVPAAAAQDAAGNPNTASNTLTRTFDTAAPTVTVDRAVSQVSPTSSRTVWFRVVFSEPIDPASFTAADVALGDDAGATTVVIGAGPENNGRTFNLAVSGMTQAGAVTAGVPAGRVTDLAGNPNAASTSTTGTIEYTPPLPGLVRAWGDNWLGQTTVPDGLTGVTAIAAGEAHTVALRSDGTVVAWGRNFERQTDVPPGLTGVTAIAAGGFHTVALHGDGTVVAWGANSFGQTTVPPGLTGVTAIAAGWAHTVALRGDGTVRAWGANSFGQTTVPPGLTGVTAIAAGGEHTVALRSDGTVVAWGRNSAGQTTVPAGLTGVTAIAAGGEHTVALRSDGTVVAWGRNSAGQTTVPDGLTGVTAIAAGYAHTVALRSDGTVRAWGWNFFGQTTVPPGLTGVTTIAAGFEHTVALARPTPPAPTILAPVEGARLNTARPAISGTAEAGATVTVLIDGGALGTATADAGGAWSLTPAADLAEGERVAVARATNSLGITGPDSPARTFTIDTTAPSVSVSSPAPDPTSTSPIPVTVTFGEDVTGFAAADLEVTNATVGDFSGSGATYTFTLTPSGQGSVGVRVPAAAAQDAAGNPNTASNALTRTFDTTTPSVTVSSPAPDPTSTSPIPVTVTFGEDVTGFAAADLEVTNATVGDFSGSGATYTFTLTPSGQGSVGVRVPAAAAQDAAGNPNTVSNTLTRTFDTTAPSVTVSSPAPDPTSTSPIPVTVTFGEGVTGFAAADLEVTNATVGDFSGSGATYTFTLTPSGQGSVGVRVPAAAAQDAAGNPNTASNTLTRAFDTTAPTVTVAQATGQADPTNAGPITFRVVFSEPVVGFTNADVTLGGPASPASAVVTEVAPNDGTTFDVAVSGMTGDGTVTASLVAGVAADLAGNGNEASTAASVTFDATAPTATITADPAQGDPTSAVPVRFRVVFSEPVVGFTNADVTLGGTASPASAVVTEVAPNDGTTFDVAVSGMTGDGDVTASLAAGVAADLAGNPSPAAGPATVQFTPPTPVVTGIVALDPSPTNAATMRFRLTFSEPVTGLDVTDLALTVSGPTGASIDPVIADGPQVYIVTVQLGAGDGTLRLDLVDDDTIQSAAAIRLGGLGRDNGSFTAGAPITVDRTAPTLTLAPAAGQADPADAPPLTFTLTASEPVAGLDAADLTLGGTAGPADLTLTGGGPTYTVTVGRVARAGTVTLALAAAAVTDAAGNPSAAVGPAAITVADTVPPAGALTAPLVARPADSSSAPYLVAIRYTDGLALDATSFGADDLTVTGPGGPLAVTLVSVDTPGDGPVRIVTYAVAPPGGAWDAADRGAYTVALTPGGVRDTSGNAVAGAALGTFTVTAGFTVALPLVVHGALPAAPDLVVERVEAAGETVRVTIRNVGDAAVTTPFWVDAYIAPARAPRRANETWPLVGTRGAVWGVTAPLAPGASLTLTVGDRFYRAGESAIGGAIAPGTVVYAQVDSANAASPDGAVRERHELAGEAYNNIGQGVAGSGALAPASSGAPDDAPGGASDAPLAARPRD